jgi:hypothetical protein
MVRKRAKSFWLSEQAAVRTSRSAAVGPVGELTVAIGVELDSCAEALFLSGRNNAIRTNVGASTKFFRDFTSVLCGA